MSVDERLAQLEAEVGRHKREINEIHDTLDALLRHLARVLVGFDGPDFDDPSRLLSES